METSTILTIVSLVVGHLIELGVFIWYLSGRLSKIQSAMESNGGEIAKVEKTLDDHIEKFDSHLVDRSVHTTEEQRRDISRRIDDLSSTVASSSRELGTKIDNLAMQILGRKG